MCSTSHFTNMDIYPLILECFHLLNDNILVIDLKETNSFVSLGAILG